MENLKDNLIAAREELKNQIARVQALYDTLKGVPRDSRTDDFLLKMSRLRALLKRARQPRNETQELEALRALRRVMLTDEGGVLLLEL